MSPTLLLTLAALAVLAVTLVAVGIPLIARLRAQEGLGGSASSDAGISAINELGQRIETLVSQQQEQGETQRQHLAQQLDSVEQTIGEQRVLVDGLRSEVRHESKRRDHELDEIRTQIASIQQAIPALGSATPLALPEASDAVSGEDVTFEDAAFEDASFSEATFDEAPLDEASLEEEPTGAVEDSLFTEVVDPFALEPLEVAETDELATQDEPTVETETVEADTGDTDTWATPDWSEAALPEVEPTEASPVEMDAEESTSVESDDFAFFAEEFDVPEAPSADAFSAEPIASEMFVDATETLAMPAEDMDVFANVDDFEVVSFEPELEADPAASPSAETFDPAPDASSTDAPDEGVVFEELAIEEMSLEDMSFADPQTTPEFDPAEAAQEIDAIEASLATLMPSPPATDTADTSIFTDALPSTELAPSAPPPGEMETGPEMAIEALQPEMSEQASAEAADPFADDIFAPTPFTDEAVPAADPLDFAESFVPTTSPSTDAVASSEDVFASWTPDAFEAATPVDASLEVTPYEATPAEASQPPLAFTEEPAEPAVAAPNEVTPVDLSTFEDWGLDPEPVAPAPEAQTPSWSSTSTSETTFDAWAPAPVPQAPSAPTEDPESPHPTAWVVRNETLQPSTPPVAEDLTPDENPTQEATFAYSEPTPTPEMSPASEEVVLPPVSDDSQGTAVPALSTISVMPTAPSPSPEPSPEPSSDEETERLTVLPSIDEDLERALHLAGVTTLDEMARWGRTDARRIAGTVGVSEETVLNHWVFEAQTALFERFTQQVGS